MGKLETKVVDGLIVVVYWIRLYAMFARVDEIGSCFESLLWSLTRFVDVRWKVKKRGESGQKLVLLFSQTKRCLPLFSCPPFHIQHGYSTIFCLS